MTMPDNAAKSSETGILASGVQTTMRGETTKERYSNGEDPRLDN